MCELIQTRRRKRKLYTYFQEKGSYYDFWINLLCTVPLYAGASDSCQCVSAVDILFLDCDGMTVLLFSPDPYLLFSTWFTVSRVNLDGTGYTELVNTPGSVDHPRAVDYHLG